MSRCLGIILSKLTGNWWGGQRVITVYKAQGTVCFGFVKYGRAAAMAAEAVRYARCLIAFIWPNPKQYLICGSVLCGECPADRQLMDVYHFVVTSCVSPTNGPTERYLVLCVVRAASAATSAPTFREFFTFSRGLSSCTWPAKANRANRPKSSGI